MKRSPKDISEDLVELEERIYRIWSQSKTDQQLTAMADRHQELRDELRQQGINHFTLSMILDIMETKALLSKSLIRPGSVSMAKFEDLKYKGGALTRDAIRQVEEEGNAIPDPARRDAFFNGQGMWFGDDS